MFRAKAWLETCNRLDLMPKIKDLHKNYRLCEQHFEEKHISKGSLRKTLLPDALPILFSYYHPTRATETENKDGTEEPPKKIIILSSKYLFFSTYLYLFFIYVKQTHFHFCRYKYL